VSYTAASRAPSVNVASLVALTESATRRAIKVRLRTP